METGTCPHTGAPRAQFRGSIQAPPGATGQRPQGFPVAAVTRTSQVWLQPRGHPGPRRSPWWEEYASVRNEGGSWLWGCGCWPTSGSTWEQECRAELPKAELGWASCCSGLGEAGREGHSFKCCDPAARLQVSPRPGTPLHAPTPPTSAPPAPQDPWRSLHQSCRVPQPPGCLVSFCGLFSHPGSCRMPTAGRKAGSFLAELSPHPSCPFQLDHQKCRARGRSVGTAVTQRGHGSAGGRGSWGIACQPVSLLENCLLTRCEDRPWEGQGPSL